VRSNALMCGRTYSSWAVLDLFLGHISPIPPHFPIPAARLSHSPSPFPPPKSLPNIQITAAHHLPTTSRPFAGPSPTSPPTAGRPLAGFHFSPFFYPKSHFFQFLHFSSVFLVDCGHKSILGLCPIVWLVLCWFVQGVGLF
jgi:hypothetical protein